MLYLSTYVFDGIYVIGQITRYVSTYISKKITNYPPIVCFTIVSI